MLKMLEIKLSKCLLLLTEREIQSLLARDRELWMLALQRGKAVKQLQRFERPVGMKRNGESVRERGEHI
ncbi:MAG: hypothetical protein DDT21_00345 [Syntrophomonadaceae bacterium]|nr:hypothetical protein [Bacillota bacterium]